MIAPNIQFQKGCGQLAALIALSIPMVAFHTQEAVAIPLQPILDQIGRGMVQGLFGNGYSAQIPSNYPPFTGTQGTGFPDAYPTPQPEFPQPGYPPTYPQPQQGYPQQGYQPTYSQPQQPGYPTSPQPAYPQPGYQPGYPTYPQPAYSQPGYSAYPQPAYPQPGYPAYPQAYPQQAYPPGYQQVYPQPYPIILPMSQPTKSSPPVIINNF